MWDIYLRFFSLPHDFLGVGALGRAYHIANKSINTWSFFGGVVFCLRKGRRGFLDYVCLEV